MVARLEPINLWLLAGFAGLLTAVGMLAGADPKLAIAASAAIAFMLIVFADLTLGLALFAFFSFLEVLQVASVLSVSKLAGIPLALGWLAFVLTREDAKSDFLTVHPVVSMALGVFLGWVALSVVWAESPSIVVGAFGRYLLNVILFLIVFSAIRNKRQAMLVISGFLIGAVAAAVYGLVFATAQVDYYGGRLTGSNLDPNQLASVLVAGIPLSAGLAIAWKGKPLLRLAAVVSGGFCLITALLTGSRGGVIALACMLVAAILVAGRWRAQVAVVSVLIVALGSFYVVALAPPDIRDRIESSSEGQARQQEGRSTLWEIGQRMVRAHPGNGVGAGNFPTSSRHYLLQPGVVYRSDTVLITPQVVHNTYLEIAAELGLVGIGLFGSVVLFSVGSSLWAARNFSTANDPSGEALARAVVAAMVGVLVADFFISQEYNKQLWLMLGIGPAILAVSRRSIALPR